MKHFSRKAPTLIFLALLAAFFGLAGLFPSAGARLGMACLALSLLLASFFIVRQQRAAYRRGGMRRSLFLWNVAVEVTGLGLAMVMAGTLGRTVAALAVDTGGDALVRFTVAIGIGLLAGPVAGLLVSRSWGRLVRNGA
jgi:hypothetical protein